MSLFGSLMGDVEDDPFFGPHMRHMQQMNNFMNSMFSDPFGMLNDGPLAIGGPRHGNALMPFMPQMPINRLFSADMTNGPLTSGSSFSSSTVVMSSGPNGAPQVFSSTSRTKIGPNGIKETQKTLQDSRTGVKKMSIGHHIGERAHVIEREQNVYSGDAEERQEFINLEEEEAEDFDREFQHRSGMHSSGSSRRALPPAPARASPAPRLALPAPPIAPPLAENSRPSERAARHRPSARRPIRSALTDSSGVREVYGGAHPQRQKPRHRSHRNH